jgi:hypothetical protein
MNLKKGYCVCVKYVCVLPSVELIGSKVSPNPIVTKYSTNDSDIVGQTDEASPTAPKPLCCMNKLFTNNEQAVHRDISLNHTHTHTSTGPQHPAVKITCLNNFSISPFSKVKGNARGAVFAKSSSQSFEFRLIGSILF